MSTLRRPSFSSPALIGRGEQLALLAELLDLACASQGRIALIAGEAGIGKSRLAAELAARAQARGARCLLGRCFEHDRGLPYAPLADMLRAFAESQAPHELLAALGPTAPELLAIAPGLAAALPTLARDPAREPEHEKRRLFAACTRFVRQLAAGQPLLLVLEDLHWCDDTSLEWLLSLARDLAGLPLLVLLTYRDDETHPALDALLAALDRIGHAGELVLPRLGPPEVAAMLQAIFELAQPPRAEFLDTIYSLTDGNPLFIEEVLKSLVAAGEIYREGGGWTRKPLRELHIPRTVQVAVRQRTGQLSPGARQLLTLAAVAGQRFDFGVLQEATGQAEAELLEQVKQLVAAHLVVEENEDQFSFRHALTREAIYGGLLARERRGLHRAVAEGLERRYAGALGAHAGELAHHWDEAGEWAKGLEWANRAAEQASRLYAHGEALSHYRHARHCAEQLGLREQVAATDHAIGKIQRARSQFPQAIEAYTAALQATADPARRAVLKVDLGEAYVGAADERALPLLREALEELDPAAQGHDAARATLWLGRYYHLRAHYAQAIGYLERARQLLEPLGDPATLRFVYHYMAAALLFAGRFAESERWTRRCIELGQAAQSLPAVAVGYWYLAKNAFYQGRWGDTYAEAGRGQASVQAYERQSGVRYMDWAAIPPVSAAYCQGELATGVRLARACVQQAAEVGDHRAALWTNRVLVMLEAAQGHEGAALALGEQCVRDADGLMEVPIRCWSRIALADLAMQREEWGRASQLHEECAEVLSGTQSMVVQIELGAPMAAAYCAQGRLAEAAELIGATLVQAEASGARHFHALAWRVQAQVWVAQGRLADAARAFGTAVALCEELGSRLELAQALVGRGALARAQGDMPAARADWQQARALCEQLGAQALLWRVQAALGQLALEQGQPAEAERACAAARAIVDGLAASMDGEALRAQLRERAARHIPAEPPVATRRAAKAEFGGLTERERAVAELIARGHSNREIAQALVVSERTVTTHVGNIFSKLGFTSRAQVASWVGERGQARASGE